LAVREEEIVPGAELGVHGFTFTQTCRGIQKPVFSEKTGFFLRYSGSRGSQRDSPRQSTQAQGAGWLLFVRLLRPDRFLETCQVLERGQDATALALIGPRR
jgi:hypothetical protein